MTKKFLFWWLLFSMKTILLLISLFLFNGLEFLLKTDITYLSFVLILMWFCSSIATGVGIFYKKNTSETLWFIAESCMTIGMIGTVLGFIYMLSTSFASIDPSNIESMKNVISDMASGMGTALLTTFCGLVTSLSLKTQIIMSEVNS